MNSLTDSLNYPHDQELIETIQQMTLMDDVFFNSFMDNNIEAMEYILNIIMERNDLKVLQVQTQHSIPNLYGRSVRFDVFATDQHGHEYDFEVQNANNGAEPQRARYNSDMLDFNRLKAGDDFTELAETYVIFITANDVLGYGLPIYHIERCIMEVNQTFDDKAHIIYVNGKNTSDTLLGQLMKDFHQSDPDKIKAKILSDRMKYLKSNNEEVTKMCNIVEEYTAKKVAEASALSKNEGILEGERRTNLNNLKNLMQKQQISAAEAMETLGIDEVKRNQYMALL